MQGMGDLSSGGGDRKGSAEHVTGGQVQQLGGDADSSTGGAQVAFENQLLKTSVGQLGKSERGPGSRWSGGAIAFGRFDVVEPLDKKTSLFS